MAYDKILVIHARLDKRINYALNEAKTKRTENGQILQTAINCQLDTAYRDMLRTKRRWDKENRPIQGYHIIHSFSPGEVTPEQAHALSVEFAGRLLQGRFEAVVATHIDHGHIHAHIVFNSVSCTDGKMYRDDFKAYYGDIRGLSNDISRENDLSVIKPKGIGKPYAEWNAEKNGKPTVRGLIRQDIDAERLSVPICDPEQVEIIPDDYALYADFILSTVLTYERSLFPDSRKRSQLIFRAVIHSVHFRKRRIKQDTYA